MGFFDFLKSKPQGKIVNVEITEEGITIDGNLISFPISISHIKEIIGYHSRLIPGSPDSNDIYVWDPLGIYILVPVDTDLVAEINILISKTKGLAFLPKSTYRGNLIINGINIKDKKLKSDTYIFHEEKVGTNTVVIQIEKNDTSAIRSCCIYPTPSKKEPKDPDKYKINPIKDNIVFTDFNFKLLIIEELMYNKELLVPKIDVYEFTELYAKRDIDIEEEGYDPIPEIEEYFRALPISKEMATKVSSIYQDGGNKVYSQIIPFWDGEDEYFDLKSVEDAKYFPNLKKAVIFGTDKELIENLKSYGIDAQPL